MLNELLDWSKSVRLEGWLGVWGAALGTWGAVLSTWIFVRDARKRPRVELGVHVGPIPLRQSGALSEPVLLLNMVAGDLPAKVIHMGIITSNRKWAYPGHPPLPEIAPHQAGTYSWPLAQLITNTQPGYFDGSLRAFATLADGRHFFSKKFRLTDPPK